MGRENDMACSVRSRLLASVQQDLRYGLRMLWKNPGFSLVSVLTLALGIGGNAAIFTATNALLFKAFPYKNPHRLVRLNTQRRGDADQGGGFSLNRYELIRDRNHSFSGIAVWAIDSFNLVGRGQPNRLPSRACRPIFSVC
jgi:putative ABC transport system permease protein